MLLDTYQAALNEFKYMLESVITTGYNEGKNCGNGLIAKESLIRSSKLINLIHQAVKKDLIEHGIEPERIFPPYGHSKPELKIAGFLKQKDQDICVIPKSISKSNRIISWGPMQFEHTLDSYGQEFSERTLVINVRSQMSSLAKNADTLFERTFAEPMNLHLIYPKMVLGDVYLIPIKEYDENAMRDNKIVFKRHYSNVLKYISFFAAISNRQNSEDNFHKYERCALIIVDFQKDQPKIYTTTDELKADGIIPLDCNINFDKISISTFTKDILEIYNERFLG